MYTLKGTPAAWFKMSIAGVIVTVVESSVATITNPLLGAGMYGFPPKL